MVMNMIAGGKTPTGTKNITENGAYDVTNFATANVNVPADEPVLLWTNNSPTSEFPTQDISVSTGYNAYIIETQYSTSSDTKTIGFVNVGSVYTVYAGRTGYDRVFTAYNNRVNCSVGSIAKQFVIPVRIWGVKFTL